jgi:hypothetical protein
MSKFNETYYDSGEMWLRDPSGTIHPANSALSNFYSKYKTINQTFYSELTSNQIKRFDFFYDVVFIETKSGHIFDKIEVVNDKIVPVNLDNRFLPYSYSDYWLDESNKKIYNVINKIDSWSLSSVDIGVMLEQFDIIRNSFNLKLYYQINLNFNQNIYSNIPIIEPPKITFNLDTDSFNVSFILRGPNKEFSLISTNIKKQQFLEISEINCYIPFTPNKNVSSSVLEQNILETDFYN